MRFELDKRQDAANKPKHGVSFEEEPTVFYDDQAIFTGDPDEAAEDRFVLLGLSASLRALVVCHCYREDDAAIRIISARKAYRRLQLKVAKMRDRYDFSKGKRNPYSKRLKKQITIRLDDETLEYFKTLAEDTEVPYQTLINLYLRECAAAKTKSGLKRKATG